jgi:vanillate O-demethylase monooxygenase subunit
LSGQLELFSPPTKCSFAETDWRALARYWYPVAFAHDVKQKPLAVQLLDEKLVLWRTGGGTVCVARDLCLHRGVPLSMGLVEGDELVCKYHGFRYASDGRCVKIPAHPGAAIPPKLCLRTHPVRDAYGLIWVQIVANPEAPFPEFSEWTRPDYVQVLPESVTLNSSGGRQVEGFLDVSHFATVHAGSFWGTRQSGRAKLSCDTHNSWV